MATQVQNRRGTTAEHSTFTGANGELTVDTTKRTLVVHDGATVGGRPLLREDQSNLPTSAPTTGIYNASGSLAISTNSVGRLFVDASGNVGVGTSPSTRLETYVASGGNTLRITNAANTGSDSCSLQFVQGGAQRAVLYTASNILYLTGDATTVLSAGSTSPLVFNAGGSERLRITSAGLVGVGTSSPVTTLDVRGSALFNAENAFWGFDATTDPRIGFVKQSGNTPFIGLGSATPFQISHSSGTGINSPSTQTYTPRFTINSSGNVGIGTTSPGGKLQINTQDGFLFDVGAGAYAYMRFGSQGAGEGVAELANERTTGKVFLKTGFTGSTLNTRLEIDGAGATIINNQSGTERARIDSSGRLLVGTSSARSNFFNGANAAQIQLEGTNYQSAAFAIVCNTNGDDKGSLILAKNRGTTVGSNTIVQDGDDLGSIEFQGSDGAEFVQAAAIKAEVDGTPGANDMPGRLVFSVTPDSKAALEEAMRIKNSKIINFANAPTYADNTAAIAGGLAAGDVYKKADGTLMITF